MASPSGMSSFEAFDICQNGDVVVILYRVERVSTLLLTFFLISDYMLVLLVTCSLLSVLIDLSQDTDEQ